MSSGRRPTSLAERVCTLTVKLASPWGLPPATCFPLKQDSFKMSCREINTVCPEGYRDTFIGIIFRTYLYVERLPSALVKKQLALSSPGQASPRGARRTRAAKGGCFSPTSPPLSRVVPHPPPPGTCLAWSGPLLPSSLPGQGPCLTPVWTET